jgi:site-specific DNA recombinase
MINEGLLLIEIAERLGCDRNVITKAIKHWHQSRGLPVPDGRARREELTRKTRNVSR